MPGLTSRLGALREHPGAVRTAQVLGGPRETLRHIQGGSCAHPVTQASAFQELVG